MSSPRALDPRLASALLPALLHRIQNTTQLLMALRSMLARDDALASEDLGSSLAHASRSTDAQGWLVGLLARSMGSDVLLVREERDALRLALGLVADAVRHSRGELRLPKRWPRLTLCEGSPRSADLALGVSAFVWASHVAGTPGSRLELSRGEDGWTLELDPARPLEACAAFEGSTLERCGARLDVRAAAVGLWLPPSWLEAHE